MMRRAQPWLGTIVDIRIADALSDEVLNSAFDLAFAGIAQVHQRMSFHAPDSDVTRINLAAVGSVIDIDPGTVQVLRAALRMTADSGGIFNISCATRLVQWNLLPSLDRPLPAYSSTDCGLRMWGETAVKKLRPVWIDLGGIAKGYAVDVAIAILRDAGIKSACVNAGGDARVLGSLPYPMTIRDPQTLTPSAMQVDLVDAALATSASYFSQRQLGDNLVSALVDGRSGNPRCSTSSVSVIAPSCMMADALTKIVNATGDVTHPLLIHFDAHAFIL